MKIRDIITEAVGLDPHKLAAQISKDCQPYLRQNHSPKEQILWRGIQAKVGSFVKVPNPVNREPRDTSPTISKMVDDVFFESVGIRFRSNALFATGDRVGSEEYGVSYAVFPIGQFQFCWSPIVSDMTFGLFDDGGLSNAYQYSEEEIEFEVEHRVNSAKYTTTLLDEAIQSGHEVMLHAPEGFYLLKYFEPRNPKPYEFFFTVVNWIGLTNQ
jgi:hypothetical protein